MVCSFGLFRLKDFGLGFCRLVVVCVYLSSYGLGGCVVVFGLDCFHFGFWQEGFEFEHFVRALDFGVV